MASTKMARNKKKREAKLTIHEKMVTKRNEDFENCKKFVDYANKLKQ